MSSDIEMPVQSANQGLLRGKTVVMATHNKDVCCFAQLALCGHEGIYVPDI
ncbi:hypothetical protein [Vibrio hangzhouensis]|uniref:hypothetical protein n=1 Tax=Vibrio hangzhouensis TaxID=462991 RepID=UPI0013599DDC|nr:hypothetical protein [Vibrio hangzhouensis]